MTKIKVTVKSIEQANELIEFWKDKDVELEISVEAKENTTNVSSDVNKTIKTESKIGYIEISTDETKIVKY